MSMKRRDNKGRILRDGELQRKDGKYEYRYTDQKGGRHSIYSWRLVETDKTPAGKRITPSLRELSSQIQREIAKGTDIFAAQKRTVEDYFVLLMAAKQKLKPSTIISYNCAFHNHIAPTFGSRKVGSVKYSDILGFYSKILSEKRLTAGSLKIVHNVLTQIFKMALHDGVIGINPTTDALVEARNNFDSKRKTRQPLSVPEQKSFLAFIKNSSRYKKWVPLFTVMLGTGMRIGEIGGLTWDDVDFDENLIYVRNNLQAIGPRDHKFFLSTPKSDAGTRIIPMLTEVRSALENEHKRQLEENFESFKIDDVSNFVFSTNNNRPITSAYTRGMLRTIVKKHNQKSDDIKLPIFTAHTLRHTFCTRLCENESNLKVIQKIMGHSNITITMDIYNEAMKEKKVESLTALNGKMSL